MLVRRPLSPLDVHAATFDRAFQQLARSFEASSPRRSGPALHWTDTDGALTLTVDLPGVSADAIHVEVSDRTLTVAADHDGVSWSRSARLGATYDVDSVTANHVDGRLTVTVAHAPAPAVRAIPVGTTPPAPVVDDAAAGDAAATGDAAAAADGS